MSWDLSDEQEVPLGSAWVQENINGEQDDAGHLNMCLEGKSRRKISPEAY